MRVFRSNEAQLLDRRFQRGSGDVQLHPVGRENVGEGEQLGRDAFRIDPGDVAIRPAIDHVHLAVSGVEEQEGG